MDQEEYFGFESLSLFSGEKKDGKWNVKNTLIQRRKTNTSSWEEKSITFSSTGDVLDDVFQLTYKIMATFLSEIGGSLFNVDLEEAKRSFRLIEDESPVKFEAFTQGKNNDNNLLQ